MIGSTLYNQGVLIKADAIEQVCEYLHLINLYGYNIKTDSIGKILQELH